jgi:CDP-6-deoxy-D-xylo-4-hexulose-3-dehydrase
MGEGGAVFTGDGVLKRALESIRDWGRDCYCQPGKENTCGRRFRWQLGEMPLGYDHKYIYTHLGFNLKLTDMQAAVGLAQLDRLPEFVTARRRNFDYLRQRLSSLEEFLVLPEPTPGGEPAWFGFPITHRDEAGLSRPDLLRYLDQYRIGTRMLFGGNITRQPYFNDRSYRIAKSLTNTDKVMSDTFWIGVYPGLDEAMLDFVCTRFESLFGVGI